MNLTEARRESITILVMTRAMARLDIMGQTGKFSDPDQVQDAKKYLLQRSPPFAALYLPASVHDFRSHDDRDASHGSLSQCSLQR